MAAGNRVSPKQLPWPRRLLRSTRGNSQWLNNHGQWRWNCCLKLLLLWFSADSLLKAGGAEWTSFTEMTAKDKWQFLGCLPSILLHARCGKYLHLTLAMTSRGIREPEPKEVKQCSLQQAQLTSHPSSCSLTSLTFLTLKMWLPKHLPLKIGHFC